MNVFKKLTKYTEQVNKKMIAASFIAAATSLTTLPAFAKSVLLVGKNTVVTNINGQEIRTGFFTDGAKRFELPAGQHVVKAKYEKLYDISRDEHDILKSVEIALPINMLDGQTYKIDMINQPEKYEKAVDYAEKPTLAVMHNGKILAQQTAITSSNNTGLLSGIASIFTGTGSQPVTINTTAKTNNTVKTAATVQPQYQPTSLTGNTLDNFMKVWLNATPDERAKIKSWIQDK